jgi:hypothetical protein
MLKRLAEKPATAQTAARTDLKEINTHAIFACSIGVAFAG